MNTKIPISENALANKGKRLGNYFIDTIVIMMINFGFLFAIESSNASYSGQSSLLNSFNWIYYLLALFYYTICETIFDGKSLAKFITGTTVKRRDREEFGFKEAILRSLCRMIPFDALSFLGTDGKGWHDSITKTVVVDDKLYKENEEENSIEMIGKTIE